MSRGTRRRILGLAGTTSFRKPPISCLVLQVAFLEDMPSAEAVARRDPERSPPDAFAVRGRNAHMHYPNGVARSKLTNEYLASQLQTASTMRNWRTVLTLLEVLDTP